MNNSVKSVMFNIHGPMISGIDEAQKRKYHKLIGNRGEIWLYADQPNSADNIYVNGGPGSQGFGGRTMTFELVDGTTIDLQGPWHANPHSMLAATGVDLRDKSLTRGIVALGRESGETFYSPDTYTEVLHYDEEAVVGSYDRIENLAKRFANTLGKTVFYAMKSSGGGCAGQQDPE